MEIVDYLQVLLGKIDKRVVMYVEGQLFSIPFFRNFFGKKRDTLIRDFESTLKPYKEEFLSFGRIPPEGVEQKVILEEMKELRKIEDGRWKKGFVSGAVYHGDTEHTKFLSKVYSLFSQTNPLHSDLWPSISKYEAEIVSMTAHMLGAGKVEGSRVCGVLSSGGTESILLAMKTYRDWARQEKKITKPEMVVPETAHAAFDKAAKYFQIKIIKVPVGKDGRADVSKMKKALTRNTIVMVGSAPSFPHGIIDPIFELSEIAGHKKIGFHTDACLGGFLLPWVEKLGYNVPPFDLRLPGVTSISADTHKYGYAAKGSSVILYRNPELLHFQYYTVTDWPGGLYFSPTFAGSRSGALSAMCWASLVSMGEQGYIEATKAIVETGEVIKAGIRSIEELEIIGDPWFCIAFTSPTLDIYRIMDFMTKRKWILNGLFNPPALHICLTLRHTEPGVADLFLTDLKEAVQYVLEHPKEKGGMAPIYGLAASLPLKGTMSELLKAYLDVLYKV